ncbi:MAG: molybdopterin molybdotransferase MoeA [Phycisphaerae bacterium]|nr:molybdopterin molybdotransferase MoeA [Phycisphaerae bacterium]
MAATGPTSPGEAVALFTARLVPVGTERVPLEVASGRVLAEPLVADRPSPAIGVSAMDGYAVDSASFRPGVVRVAGEARIGREPVRLEPGSAVKVSTGAPVPLGADAVIKREDVAERGGTIEVAASVRVPAGVNVRRRGENLDAGARVLGAGEVIGPSRASALACFGAARPLVHRRVRVALLVTGDEVRDAADPVADWELRDSNGPALRALLGGVPWIELLPPRRCPDDPDVIRSTAEAALSAADLLLCTGGVSMGDRDFIPEVLRSLGAQVAFHRIPQRPGKPVLGALTPRNQGVLGLPGNPLSVMVTARRMAVPVAMHLAGIAREPSPPLVAIDADARGLDLWWHRLVRLSGPGRGELAESRGSGDVPSAARADGFVEVPRGRSGAGPWPFYPWGL